MYNAFSVLESLLEMLFSGSRFKLRASFIAYNYKVYKILNHIENLL